MNEWCINSFEGSKEKLSLEGEVWKDVLGFEDIYQISNLGRLINKTVPNYRSRLKNIQILKDGCNGNGYRRIPLRKLGNQYNRYIHRLVAEVFIPNPYKLPQVNHIDGDKTNNTQVNLEWVSSSENIRKAHEAGQMVNRTVHKTKIDVKSDEFVSQMYRMYKETGKVGATARAFNVPRTSLSSIVNKRSRVKLTDAIDEEYE
tara:strand:- start:2657 stop:3262 length:606 start_codon:yes stop_codon:yes gene_type:complete